MDYQGFNGYAPPMWQGGRYGQTYPQGAPNYQQTAPQTPTPAQTDMIWVQGEAAAKSYLVAPGHSVPLWDSETQTIFLKSVDASGMPSMRILDYTERTAPRPAPQGVEYAPRQEMDTLAQRVDELAKQIEALTPRGRKVKEAEPNG